MHSERLLNLFFSSVIATCRHLILIYQISKTGVSLTILASVRTIGALSEYSEYLNFCRFRKVSHKLYKSSLSLNDS